MTDRRTPPLNCTTTLIKVPVVVIPVPVSAEPTTTEISDDDFPVSAGIAPPPVPMTVSREPESESEAKTSSALGREMAAAAADLRGLKKAKAKAGGITAEPKADEAGPATPIINPSEVNCARRLAACERLADLKYSPVTGKWMAWTGTHWAEDKTRAVNLALDRWVKRGYLDRLDMEDPQGKSFRRRMMTNAGRRAVLELVRDFRTIDITELDRDPLMFNTLSGVLDLQTSTVLPHDRQMLGRVAGVTYDPTATAPTWERYIHEVTLGDQDKMDILQAAAGYSLSGMTDEHLAMFLVGDGSNGKSLFVDTLAYVLGGYAGTSDSELIIESRVGEHTTARSSLEGRRYVVISELPDNARLASQKFKQIVSSSPMTVRNLYEAPREIQPQLKLWVATNYLPKVSDNSEGQWRRIVPVKFEAKYSEETKDVKLGQKLRAEGPGILNWMLKGWERVRDCGLIVPATIKAELSIYRDEEDVVRSFIEEAMVQSPSSVVPCSEVYRVYKLWTFRNRHHTLSQNSFGREMTRKGLDRVTSQGVRSYLGWWLRDTYAVETPNEMDHLA